MLTCKSVSRRIQKYPVMAFCLLAFSITWGLKYWYALVRTEHYIPPFNFSLIAQFGPSIVGVLLISLTEGVKGIRNTIKSILKTAAQKAAREALAGGGAP